MTGLAISLKQVRRRWFCRFSALSLLIVRTVVAGQEGYPPQSQWKAYEAEIPKTILELQPFRQSASVRIRSGGGREGSATLVNLNPSINAWYLLKVAWKGGGSEMTYHLENTKPQTRSLLLSENYPSGLVIAEANNRHFCELFGPGAANTLDQARTSPLVYYPLCENRIYVRNPVTGHRTTLEATTEFLREHVWGGETIIALGHILMGETHRETGKVDTQAQAAANEERRRESGDLPVPARIDPKCARQLLESSNLGVAFEAPDRRGMTPGAWYPATGNPGVYVSILQPNLIDSALLESYKTVVNTLDGVEASALCYLVAFDLDRFELGYALGTDHPKVGWSDRVLERMRIPMLPGPDGIGSIRPLIATGLVSPEDAGKTVATFTGGFKRTHGAFKYGDLALRNHGSHYGFIENGVIFSKLQPGLATLFVLDDGSIEMKTWTERDNALLARIKCARQNGVPLVEWNEASQSPIPGALVARWGAGNWSGSEAGQLRTMRSGVAVQKNRGKRFLIYAVFSDATPSAMARIFQAYRCDYAMLLDMNALEHTYLALYRRSGSQMLVDHLIKGMSALDKSTSGQIVPRFLGYADNRDFFYVMRRNGEGAKP